jgi:ATP synthase F1 delta subunit
MDIDIQYARALMQIHRVEWLPILEQLEKVTDNPEFQDLLANPFVAYKSIIELLTACLGSTNQKQKNLIHILAKNKRLLHVKKIRLAYQQLQREKNKEQLVTITTAQRTTKAQQKIIESFATTYLEKKIKPLFQYQESAELIGGFILNINDYIINKSVTQQLDYVCQFIEGEHTWQHN